MLLTLPSSGPLIICILTTEVHNGTDVCSPLATNLPSKSWSRLDLNQTNCITGSRDPVAPTYTTPLLN